jgi:hypothetical protein
MPSHSRALADILLKNAPKKALEKVEIKKESSKLNNKK